VVTPADALTLYPDLAAVASRWAELSAEVRLQIVTLVAAARK
jgi:hypothetical protein